MRRSSTRWICGAILLCLACGPTESGPMLDLPPRPDDAPGGDAIVGDLRGLDVEAREERIYAEVARGNVPGWLRQLERVEVTVETEAGSDRVTFWATPDYLAIGSESDYFYVPLSPRTAQRVADLVGASLPTPRMVDAIWLSARSRLVPIRIRPDESMRTMRDFERHNNLVQAQQTQQNVRPGTLVAGHRLDVVRTAPGAGPEDVAFYGWHRSDGTPIQPVHRIDAENSPHFSVGVRLVREGPPPDPRRGR